MIKSKSSFINNIYVLLVCLFCLMSILNSTYINDIIPSYGKIYSNFQNIFTILFTILALLNMNFSKKKLLIAYSFIIVLFVILLQNNDKTLVILASMVLALPSNLKISNLSKKIILTNFLTISSVVFLCKIGVLTDHHFIQRGTIRHGLGFVSANALSNLVTATIVMYIFHKKEKFSFINAVICCCILITTSYLTNSRLAMYLGFASIITSFVLSKTVKKEKSNFNNLIFLFSKNIFFIFSILSIIFTIYICSIPYNNILSDLNELFTGRINQMIDFYNQYGIHLVGKPIFTIGIKQALESGQKWVGIDTAYLNYTLRYGVIFMFFMSILYRKMCQKLQKNSLIFESTYVIILCIMGITENILLLPYYNFAIFLIASCLKQENEGEI